MKHYNKILIAIAALFMVSCAEEFGSREIDVEAPGNVEDSERLNSYSVLKEYVSSESFKLGAGVDVEQFLNRGALYGLSASNFAELTPAKALTHGAVVAENGVKRLSTVRKFVELAKESGNSIYGHTLMWHAQQSVVYLKSLVEESTIVDSESQNFETDDKSNWAVTTGSGITAEIGYTDAGKGSDGEGRALTITNSAVGPNTYDTQFFFIVPAPKAVDYTFTMDIKSDAPNGSISTQGHSSPGNYVAWGVLGTVSTTTEWKTFTWKGVGTSIGAGVKAIAFDLGAVATTYYIDNIKWEEYSEPKLVPMIKNGDFEGDDESNYLKQNQGTAAYTADGEGNGGVGRAFTITNPAVQTNAYDSQFIPFWTPVMKAGETYEFSIDIKADVATTIGTQAQNAPGGYMSGMQNLNITTEWKTFTNAEVFTGGAAVMDGMGAISFDLGKTATTFYFDNLRLDKVEVGGSVEPFDPEVQVENLTNEMEDWIGSIMEATEGYVTAWDVVNQPMSDADPTQLRSAETDPEENSFYWQDYLGEDYARMAVKFAREKSEVPLTLFVNEFGLEAVGNEKAKGLIAMINNWESDGETMIDGIGAEMHVSYSMNAATQAAQESAIVEMLNLLATTGKQIKITLDMGITDESGAVINTVNVGYEQQQKMAEFYTFIVQKYLAIIPAAKQYGITQWSTTDNASNATRSNEPVGLWDSNYKRKLSYEGFLNGLGGTPAAPAAE
jgi:GH35 family endo-1,4-beta-xylanase